MRHYGTVRVPGIASVCYKIGLTHECPKGYRIVGNGTSYTYVTNDKHNPGNDVCTSCTVKYNPDATAVEGDVAKIKARFIGKTRRNVNGYLARYGLIRTEGLTCTVVAPLATLELTFESP